MNSKVLLVSLSIAAMFAACSQQNRKAGDNPLLKPSPLFMQAPEFDKITEADFRPAFDAGLKEQLSEIESITNNPEKPTFDNTVVALERSGSTLQRVSAIFFGLASADGTDSLKAIEADMAPRLAAHTDAIYLNDKLFKRVKAVYDNELISLAGEDKRLLQFYYDKFVRAGANLSETDKTALKSLNEREASLTTRFDQMATKATNAAGVIVSSKDSLAGLSEAEIKKAQTDADAAGHKGKYLLSITNTTQQPLMANLENRDVRRKMYEASIHRCDHGQYDTQPIVAELAKIRAEKAKLLGFKNYSAWKLQDQMSKSPEGVNDFLKQVVPGYLKRAKADANEIEQFARKTAGADFKLEAWDWAFYANRLRKAKYDVNEEEIRPYFELDSVVKNGVFYSATKLFGITFKQRSDLPVYNEDVKVYDVIDKDGKQLALFYTDFYRRPTKSGGAWMSNWVEQSTLEGTLPVIYNVCNYTKPAKGEPCLLSMDEVTTLFHEFGHALHGIFASQKYRSLSGTAVARDFVEVPSQFNEHWATHPTVLSNYAKHYQTGKAMPDSLMSKMKASADFNPAYSLGENLASVTLDMAWHTIPFIAESEDQIDVQDFEQKALTKMGILNTQIPPRYISTYFRHVFSGGYASGYYSYLWSEMIEANIYDWFEANGGLTPENGQRLRDMILSRGNSEDPATLFTTFSSLTKPNVNALLKARGVL